MSKKKQATLRVRVSVQTTDDRTDAVLLAAQILSGQIQSASGVIATGALPKHRSSVDVVDLAQWILDGTGPLAAYRDEPAQNGSKL